jgi:hypothetical protein
VSVSISSGGQAPTHELSRGSVMFGGSFGAEHTTPVDSLT